MHILSSRAHVLGVFMSIYTLHNYGEGLRLNTCSSRGLLSKMRRPQSLEISYVSNKVPMGLQNSPCMEENTLSPEADVWSLALWELGLLYVSPSGCISWLSMVFTASHVTKMVPCSGNARIKDIVHPRQNTCVPHERCWLIDVVPSTNRQHTVGHDCTQAYLSSLGLNAPSNAICKPLVGTRRFRLDPCFDDIDGIRWKPLNHASCASR